MSSGRRHSLSDFEGSRRFALLGEGVRLVNTAPTKHTRLVHRLVEGEETKAGRRAEILIEIQPPQLILTAVNQGRYCSQGEKTGEGG